MADDGTRGAEWLEPPEEELGLKRYVDTIRERLPLVLFATLVTTAAALAYVFTAPKTYQAQADLLVTPISSEVLPGLRLIRESSDPTRDVETAAQLVTNTDVATAVAERLALEESPENLLKEVSAEPVAQSNIVAITAKGDTREEARDHANAFAEVAVEDQTARLQEDIEAQIEGVREQLESEPSATLSNRIAELQTLASGPNPTLRVETPAELPEDAASPRPMPTILGGLLAGLVLGTVGAFAAQILDPRLRREEQLRRRYRLPILARVPREPGGRGDEPLAPRRISASAAEAYRTLRTTLDTPEARASGPRAVLVTGSSPSEGKTTTALNLASSLALGGHRVILIESDLRRPSLAAALDIRSWRGGVVSVLIENMTLEDALVPSPAHGRNLQVLLADYSGGWIAELFSIPAAQQMIDDARGLADYVIVDSPPLIEVVDALPLARRCDEVLIVTRIGQTRLDKLTQLAELLAETRLTPAGFVVIGTQRPGRASYSYYTGSPDGGDERAVGFAGAARRG